MDILLLFCFKQDNVKELFCSGGRIRTDDLQVMSLAG